MKKVVVFGGAGFVGSRLSPFLQGKYDVTVVDTFWFWDSVEQYKELSGFTGKCIVEDIRSKDIKKLPWLKNSTFIRIKGLKEPVHGVRLTDNIVYQLYCLLKTHLFIHILLGLIILDSNTRFF